MKRIFITLAMSMTSLSLFAQQAREYDGIIAIHELHEGWLVVRLPGFEKKLVVLDSLLAVSGLTEKARRDLGREKENTLAEKEFIHKWYPVMFDSAYSFSRVASIYTNETERFQSGHLPARSASGEALDPIDDGTYFLATLHGISSDPFVFTTKDHRIPAFPFPNRIGLPGFIIPGLFGPPVPDWIRSLEDYTPIYRVYRHVYRINRKLRSFYERG